MEKTFLTPAFGLVTIPVSFMAPQETPRGIVQIVHGMCEHKERYFPLMDFLAANGYAAVCHDHIGHGDGYAAHAHAKQQAYDACCRKYSDFQSAPHAAASNAP